MPTNANVFNSRVTSETLEKKFRDTFPSQGGAELVQDLFAQGVIVPTVDFTAAAQGTELQTELQQALDFGVSTNTTANGTDVIINSTGFWKVWYQISARPLTASDENVVITMSDGLSTKTLKRWDIFTSSATPAPIDIEGDTFIVFVRAGESVSVTSSASVVSLHSAVRQVADVNGNLTNPLGFTSS